MTIPASFAGDWKGQGGTGTGFEAVLQKDLERAELNSGGGPCSGGALKVIDATDSLLKMSLNADSTDCELSKVVFTLLSGNRLRMEVDPAGSDAPFQVMLTKKG